VNSSKIINAQFKQLGETWEDPAYGKFVNEFTQMMTNIRRFIVVSDPVIPNLLRLADRVDQVHR
jgi:hypothetical protein